MDFPCESSLAAPVRSKEAPLETPPVKWRLIWCHNKSFRKQDDRAALNIAVRSLSGAMLCFKKADKFLAWLARQSQEATGLSLPYVFLTDLVGIKFLMSSPHAVPVQPVASMLLCEDVGMAQKARNWLRSQGLVAFPEGLSVHQDIGSAIQKLTQSIPRQLPASALGTGPVGPAPKIHRSLPRDEPVYLVPRQSLVEALAQSGGVGASQSLAVRAPPTAAEIAITIWPNIWYGY